MKPKDFGYGCCWSTAAIRGGDDRADHRRLREIEVGDEHHHRERARRGADHGDHAVVNGEEGDDTRGEDGERGDESTWIMVLFM